MPSIKKFIKSKWIIFLLVILGAIVYLVLQNSIWLERKILKLDKIEEIKIKEIVFQTEIVDSEEERRQGLSGRQDLCENCAMLFLFDEKERHAFWMKKMKFDLDIIWIDKDKVVDIVKNVSKQQQFEIIKPKFEADKVLEINAGLADKLELKIGDRIEF